MKSKILKLEIGFWHPFGGHAGESAEQIIKRKENEIQKTKWTLWSFSYKTTDTLNSWLEEIKKKHPRKVLVFCSNGEGTKDPVSEAKYCNYYTPVGEVKHIKIPSTIKVPHPMGKKTKGSAFIVKNIIYPTNYEKINLDWFYIGKNKWQNHRSSTFGEHLIRIGKGKPIGKFRAILELKYPYITEVGVD